MRRFAFVLVTSLAMLALVAPGVQARHGSHRPAPTFTAKSNSATQGGQLHVVAKVKHAQHGSTFSATATLHFASGDQTVTLKRHGKSFVAKGTVAVGDNETPGAVPVDVTVTYNGGDEQVETEGNVEQADDQGDDQQGDDQQGDDQGDDAGPTCEHQTTSCDDDQNDNNQGGDDQGDGPDD